MFPKFLLKYVGLIRIRNQLLGIPDLVSCRLNGYCYYQEADHRADVSRNEKEEILGKLSQSEKVQTEWRSRVTKLEDDNAKLRKVLEQSMTRLNRMSIDSDYLVDRLACLCS